MGAKVEIAKFKTTVFMAVIAAVGFLLSNADKLLKFLNGYLLGVLIIVIGGYGVIGFFINMLKLSEIEKEIE